MAGAKARVFSARAIPTASASHWIPAFAGMTGEEGGNGGLEIGNGEGENREWRESSKGGNGGGG